MRCCGLCITFLLLLRYFQILLINVIMIRICKKQKSFAKTTTPHIGKHNTSYRKVRLLISMWPRQSYFFIQLTVLQLMHSKARIQLPSGPTISILLIMKQRIKCLQNSIWYSHIAHSFFWGGLASAKQLGSGGPPPTITTPLDMRRFEEFGREQWEEIRRDVIE